MADLFLPACWPRMELPRADAFQLPFPWKTNCVPRSVCKCLLLQYRDTAVASPHKKTFMRDMAIARFIGHWSSAQHPYVVDNVFY